MSQSNQWRKDHPERAKIARRKEKFKARYGITPEQYDQMVKEREGKCDICRRVPTGGGAVGTLNVDHDHDTNKIRGLLCWQCNIAIGYLQNDTERLANAIVYLFWGSSNP